MAHQLTQKPKRSSSLQEVCNANALQEGQVTQVDVPARGSFLLTRLDGEVFAVQKAVYNEQDVLLSESLSKEILIGDRIFHLDTLDGYSIKNGLPDQFTDQLAQRFLHPYPTEQRGGKILLSQTPNLEAKDEVLTGWVGQGSQVTKVIAIVGNTKQSFDCIRTLRACKFTGTILFFPCGNRPFNLDLKYMQNETEDEFLLRNRVTKVTSKVKNFSLLKMHINLIGRDPLNYNQILLTDFGDNPSTRQEVTSDLSNQGAITIDYLTPSSLQFAFEIQSRHRQQGKPEPKVYFQSRMIYPKRIYEYLFTQVQNQPNMQMGDGGVKIMVPQPGDEILALEKEFGKELFDSSIQGLSDYDYTFIGSRHARTLFPYKVNSGQVIAYNMLHKRIPQESVSYEASRHGDNVLYQVGVCENSSAILSDTVNNWMQLCFKNNQLMGGVALNRGREMVLVKELLSQGMAPEFLKSQGLKDYLSAMENEIKRKKSSKKLRSKTMDYLKQGPVFFYR